MVVVWVFAGIYSIKKVPIDATPDITNNQVQVITLSPSLGTSDIEQFVTYPVELAMGNLPGVVEIRSISRFGLSVVTIVFEEGMGTYLPRQLVSEKLNHVKEEIPNNLGTPEIGPITTGLGEIFQYTLEVDPEFTDKYNQTDLRTFQDWIVKRQMSMVEGVVEVNTFGGKLKQYEVSVNPHQLKSMGISITEIAEALKSNNENTGGAYIEKNHKANFIRGEGLLTSIEDIENTVIKNTHHLPLLVKDVAEVKIGEAVRYGAFTSNGKDAVGGMVLMLKGANSDKVIKNVKARISQIQKSLPEGVHIKPFLDRSELIKKTTNTISSNLIEGALIVIFILILLLGNWRGGLIVASTIPLSLLFAFILMNTFDIWANLMSLGAIDFGIIVDGAVIIVEASVFFMTKHFQSKKSINKNEKDDLASKASSKMMNTAFFGQLIILIVFLPILTLTGIEGKMFKPMALTFIFAIIGAMILCLTYVPMLTALFLKVNTKENKKKSIGDKIMSIFHNLYEPILTWALKRGKIVISGSMLLLVAGGFMITTLGGEFIPKIDEGDIAMQALMKPGTALTETIETSKQIETILLKEFPDEIKDVMARIGVSEIPTDPMPMDIADMFLLLKPEKNWTKAKNKKELIHKVKEELKVIIGVNFQFSQPLELRFNELMTGARQDLVIKLFGENLDVLSEKAEQISELISGIEGISELQIEATQGLPQITVNYDRKRLAKYGLNIKEINHLISTNFGGETLGVIFEGEKKFDLVIKMRNESKTGIATLDNLFVTLKNGGTIPLKEVAKVAYVPAPMQISRENTKRKIYLGINIQNRDVESLVKEISERLDNSLDLPAGYSLEYGGSFENLKKAKDRLFIVVPIVLALIFILLFFALKSFSQALIIYVAIPLSALGGILSLIIRDMPFSISAGVGFIVLFGVAVLNGLVLISSLNELKANSDLSLTDRIKKACHNRLRPILLTAITDVLGFLPMAISTGAGAEVQKPLATVVIGGLLTATLLTLFVLPIIYQYLESRINTEFSKVTLLTSSLLVLGLLNTNPLQAQNVERVINLEEAIALAKKNYPSLKLANLQVEETKILKRTSIDIENTTVFTGRDEVGGLDPVTTIIGLKQKFDFPTSFITKSKYLKKQILLAEDSRDITENNLVRNVKSAYYTVLYFESRLNLVKQVNEIYKDFERVAKLRFETEETARLSYISASNKYQQILVAKVQAEADVKIAKQQLARWLNTSEEIEVQGTLEHNVIKSLTTVKSELIRNNPLIKYHENKVGLEHENIKVNAQSFVPKINLQYALQEGINDKNLYSYQVGLELPLWFRSKKATVQASKIRKEMANEEFLRQKIKLESEYLVLLQGYEKINLSLDYYEKTAMKLAEEQILTSVKSYKEGEIDYIAYIQNIDEALKIKQKYLELLDQNNQIITNIDFQVGRY